LNRLGNLEHDPGYDPFWFFRYSESLYFNHYGHGIEYQFQTNYMIDTTKVHVQDKYLPIKNYKSKGLSKSTDGPFSGKIVDMSQWVRRLQKINFVSWIFFS
jgi:hypothetical protein